MSEQTPEIKRSWTPYLLQGLVVIILLAVGLYVPYYFLNNKEEASKRSRGDSGVLVEVESFESGAHEIVLEATGTVIPSQKASLRSESHGRVTWLSPKFYPGAEIKKGEIIAKISQEDYAIKLSNAQIQLRQREVALVLEQAKGRSAKAELEMLKKTMTDTALSDEETALIRREPQLQEAIASLELAKNAVKQAQLDYDRSTVRAPFDAFIAECQTSVGDYLSANSPVAQVVATDVFWVQISLLPSQLAWIGTRPEDFEAAQVDIHYSIGGKDHVRKGRILSLMGSVENLGRMTQLVLAIDAPFGEPTDAPLLLGTFVHVKLTAKDKLDCIKVPRKFVREGNLLYICDDNELLEVRPFKAAFKTEEYVYIVDGLKPGERVVKTLITSPITGRKLRLNKLERGFGDGARPEEKGDRRGDKTERKPDEKPQRKPRAP